jgi:hypothetical protein
MKHICFVLGLWSTFTPHAREASAREASAREASTPPPPRGHPILAPSTGEASGVRKAPRVLCSPNPGKRAALDEIARALRSAALRTRPVDYAPRTRLQVQLRQFARTPSQKMSRTALSRELCAANGSYSSAASLIACAMRMLIIASAYTSHGRLRARCAGRIPHVAMHARAPSQFS